MVILFFTPKNLKLAIRSIMIFLQDPFIITKLIKEKEVFSHLKNIVKRSKYF